MSQANVLTAYQEIIEAYEVKWIDFHLQGNSLTNRVSIDARSKALKALQQLAQFRDVKVSISFHTTPTGLSDDQLFVLSSAASAGVKIYGNNFS